MLIWTLQRSTIQTKENKKLITVFVIYLVCISFAYGLSTIRTSMYGLHQFVTLVSSILYVVRMVFEITAFIVYYSILAYQVVLVFGNTHFAISKKTVWMHRVIITLIFVGGTVVTFGFAMQSNQLITAGSLGAVLLYVIGYYHLVFLFNWKLYKIVKYSCLENKSEVRSSMMINVMRRSTVLVTMYALFNMLLIMTIIFASFYVNYDYDVSFGLVSFFTTLQICCGGLCLFLMLRINAKYYQCLCKICDSRFKKCCDNVAVQNGIAQNAESETGRIIPLSTTTK